MLLKKRKDQQRLLKLVWMKELEDLIWNFVEIQHSYSKFNRGCKHLYINMVTNVIIVINVTCYIWYVTYHKDESNVVYVRVLKCSTSFLNFLKLFNSSRIFLKFLQTCPWSEESSNDIGSSSISASGGTRSPSAFGYDACKSRAWN